MQSSFDATSKAFHYFDDSGEIHSIRESNKHPPVKQVNIPFDDGTCMGLFLKYNPRVLFDSTTGQVVYQHCVFCGKKRFEERAFDHIRPGSGESVILCKDKNCQVALNNLVAKGLSVFKTVIFDKYITEFQNLIRSCKS